jgi:ferredoxin
MRGVCGPVPGASRSYPPARLVATVVFAQPRRSHCSHCSHCSRCSRCSHCSHCYYFFLPEITCSVVSGIHRGQRPSANPRSPAACRAYTVNLKDIDGTVTSLEVEDGQSILEVALDAGIENLPHDCKLGVCMNCAAKLESGELDQGAGMLRDDIVEKGYALLCVSMPQSDVDVKIIEEEELLAEVMDG